MPRNQNHDEASSMKRIKTFDNGSLASWSDLNHDVFLLLMMRLGVVDLLTFSGVCKPWRSFALSNRNKFMGSKTPMSISISTHANEKECYLEDFEGRKFKTILPHYANTTCIGVTCGHLIFLGMKTLDFWLLNPFTRNELRFPYVPLKLPIVYESRKAILVFLPLVSGWVFVILNRHTNQIWFSIAGKQEWTQVSTSSRILHLHGFKGKIYIIDALYCSYEMILFPKPKLMLLELNNSPKPVMFARSVENLYVVELMKRQNQISKHPYKFHELDFGEMKCVSLELRQEEFTFFYDNRKTHIVVIPESWPDISSQYKKYVRYHDTDNGGKCKYFYANMWYCIHDFLDVNCIHE